MILHTEPALYSRSRVPHARQGLGDSHMAPEHRFELWRCQNLVGPDTISRRREINSEAIMYFVDQDWQLWSGGLESHAHSTNTEDVGLGVFR